MLKMFASLLCAFGLFLSATFVPTVASASTVNYELASDSTVMMAEIEKIGLPMSDEMAEEIRGEGQLFSKLLYGATFAPVVMSAVLGTSYCTSFSVCGLYSLLPWQLKPMTALSN